MLMSNLLQGLTSDNEAATASSSSKKMIMLSLTKERSRPVK